MRLWSVSCVACSCGCGELALALRIKFPMVSCRKGDFDTKLAPSPLLRAFTNFNPKTLGVSLSFFETMVRNVLTGKCHAEPFYF